MPGFSNQLFRLRIDTRIDHRPFLYQTLTPFFHLGPTRTIPSAPVCLENPRLTSMLYHLFVYFFKCAYISLTDPFFSSQSGMPPDDGTSPPHTGINHLSPYHVFPPEQSIRSLRNAVNSFVEHPVRPDSAATNRRQGHARTVSAAGPGIQHGQGPSLQQPQAPFMTWSHDPSRNVSRPGSIHPATSNHHLRNASSTATFKIANPDPPEPDSRSMRTRTPARSQPMLADIVAAGEDAAGVVLTPRREPSRTSLKSNKSYSRYNPDEYVDPAYWGVNGPGDPPAALPAQPRPGMDVNFADRERAARLSRKTSVNSGLSYT
jgi:hypothetical protein